MRVLIVVEKTEIWLFCVLAGHPWVCATGTTREELERTMREAISFHLEGLRAEGYEVPEPTSYAVYVEVAA